MNSPLQPLRWVALLGVACVLVARVVQSFPLAPLWWIGLLLLAALTVAVALVAVLLMPRAAGTLARNLDLLIPLGLLLLAQEALALLTKLPLLGTVFGASHSLNFLNLSFGLSLHWLVGLALAVAYATWVTAAIVHLVRAGQPDLCAVVPNAFRRFLHVAGLMFVGWCGVFVLLTLMGLAMRFMNWFALVLGLPAIIAWNFATAAVLPVAMLTDGGFLSTLRAGGMASLANLRRWWGLLLAQMLLLGLVFFGYASFHSGNSHSTNWNWSVNTFWTGGYHNTCQIYPKLIATFKTQPVPLISEILVLLFAVLAVAVKLAIVQRLVPEGSAIEQPPVIGEPPPTPMPPIPPDAN